MPESAHKAARTKSPRVPGRRRRFEPSSRVSPEGAPVSSEVGGGGAAVNEEQAQFGRLIAFRRQRLGMSQEELAARMDIGMDGVSRIEQGEAPSPMVRGRLAHALRDEPRRGLTRSSLPIVGGLSLEGIRSRLRWDGVPTWLSLEAVRRRLHGDGVPTWLSLEAVRRRLHADGVPTWLRADAVQRRLRIVSAPRRPSFDGVQARLSALGGRRLGGGIAIAALLLLLLAAVVGAFGDDAAETSELSSPSAALAPLADYSRSLVKAGQAEARQERMARKRAQAAAAERRREERAAAAASREREQAESAVASTPEPPAPGFVPAPSGGGGGGSSAPAANPDVGHGLVPPG